jgi:hypothetical protein
MREGYLNNNHRASPRAIAVTVGLGRAVSLINPPVSEYALENKAPIRSLFPSYCATQEISHGDCRLSPVRTYRPMSGQLDQPAPWRGPLSVDEILELAWCAGSGLNSCQKEMRLSARPCPVKRRSAQVVQSWPQRVENSLGGCRFRAPGFDYLLKARQADS